MSVSPEVLKKIKKVAFYSYEPHVQDVLWAKPVGDGMYEFYVYYNGTWNIITEEEGVTVNISDVVGDLSTFNNDAGFITEADIEDVIEGASAGSTALQPSDIASWAKQSSKPSYTASEIGALPDTTKLADLQGDATHRTVTDAEKTTWNNKQNALTINTQISSTSQNPIQTKAIYDFVVARGENLITNGFASMLNNYNFGSFTYDGSDTDGASGSFYKIGSNQNNIREEEFIFVDISKSYRLSYSVKNTGETATYDFIDMYDIDKLQIISAYVDFYQESTTTLAQDLKDGDTVVYLTDVSGFERVTTDKYKRGLIFWNYVNSKGYQYPIGTYSRNSWADLWSDGNDVNISNNTITLSSPWNHGTFNAGTSVSQIKVGGTYVYGNQNFKPTPNNWVKKNFIFTPNKFRAGTAFVRIGWLYNYSSVANNKFSLSSISFTQNPSFDDIAELNTQLATKLPATTPYAGSQSVGGAANKAVSIPFGQVDSTSTDTAFTATVDGITELRDGVVCYIRNSVVSSGTDCTLNVNNLGAKPIYRTNSPATRFHSGWGNDYTEMFVYNSSRVEGGCWDIVMITDTNTDSTAYLIRGQSSRTKTLTSAGNQVLCLSYDDEYIVPTYSGARSAATDKTLTTESFDPFKPIIFYTGGSVTANSSLSPAYTWVQHNDVDLRFSFNLTSNLASETNVYLVCVPQSNGKVKLDSNPISQTLPVTEDGKVYIYLGRAVNTAKLELFYVHPIYYFKDGAIRQWTNAVLTSRRGVVSQTQTWTGSDAAGYDYTMSNLVYGEIPQANIDLFVEAGAVFNETTGYFELNGLTDISYKEMMQIYSHKLGETTNYCYSGEVPMRTNIKFFDTMRQTAHSATGVLYQNTIIESFNMYVNDNRRSDLNSIINIFHKAKRLKSVVGINISRITTTQSSVFTDTSSLETLEIYGTKISLDISKSPRLSLASVVYLVNNAANTSAITITLHATAFARCQADTTEYTYNGSTYTGIIAYAAAKSITIQSA